jgi:hypothetical protein
VGETPEEAYARRLRESQRVEERIINIDSEADFQRQLAEAGNKLVVLEVESAEVCQTGLTEEAELQWQEEQAAALAPCLKLKHIFQRTARDSPDVIFLAVEADTDQGAEFCDKYGIEVLPTLQFWKSGKKLWEHKGVLHLDQNLGEGVLYYGDQAANGVKPSEFVTEVRSRKDLDEFLAKQPDNVLTVINVALTSATPCVRIYPAVMALAKNFVGFASFARLLGDRNDETRQLVDELNVTQVPTFLFYRGGQEVGRHVGSDRGDLIGQILQQQNALGIAPPAPRRPAVKRAPRKAKASLW